MELDPSCDVWWREVSADVVPPIPELTMHVGSVPALATSAGQAAKVGLCRTFGDNSSGGDGGRRIVGTFVLEGPDFGMCFFTRDDGTTGRLNGGMFHILQARAAASSCEHNESLGLELRAALGSRIQSFLASEDRSVIARISGSSFESLQEAVLSLGSCELGQILSPVRFFPSSLNSMGLHMLRALLAERMKDARVRARGLDQHPDFEAWNRDGLIVKDLDALGDEGLLQLLRMASGELEESIPLPPYRWIERNVTVTADGDPQNDFHLDTFASCIKVWVFDASVTLAEGPLEFALGSHRETETRLRWMHAYSLPPAAEALVEPSFRLEGSASAVAAASDFVQRCHAERRPLLPLPGVARTLVIADTSALHRRGQGTVGRTRMSWRLPGPNDGGLRRLDPYRLPTGSGIAAGTAGAVSSE